VRDLVADDATPWLAERFERFFLERARAQGKPVFLHKFTGWPRAAFIDRVLPEARFVHVIRDGRAVASSLLQMPWWRGYLGPSEWGWGPLPEPYAREWEASGRSFAVLAGIEWKMLIDAFGVAKAAVAPDRWLEVRYEDFVADARGSLAAMLGFFGLGWTDAYERAFVRHPVTTGRTDAFRRELAPRDVEALDGTLAGHLARLGYESASTPRKERATT
jgi:hypothetical protein